MRFGEDIYALSVAMLHKKNAKHLKYFDQDEDKKRILEKANKHMASRKHNFVGSEDEDCDDKEDHQEMH